MVEALGWLGLSLLLFAYYLDATDKLSDKSKSLFAINFAGATSIALHAYFIGSIPILILNIAWALISLYGLIKN